MTVRIQISEIGRSGVTECWRDKFGCHDTDQLKLVFMTVSHEEVVTELRRHIWFKKDSSFLVNLR